MKFAAILRFRKHTKSARAPIIEVQHREKTPVLAVASNQKVASVRELSSCRGGAAGAGGTGIGGRGGRVQPIAHEPFPSLWLVIRKQQRKMISFILIQKAGHHRSVRPLAPPPPAPLPTAPSDPAAPSPHRPTIMQLKWPLQTFMSMRLTPPMMIMQMVVIGTTAMEIGKNNDNDNEIGRASC